MSDAKQTIKDISQLYAVNGKGDGVKKAPFHPREWGLKTNGSPKHVCLQKTMLAYLQTEATIDVVKKYLDEQEVKDLRKAMPYPPTAVERKHVKRHADGSDPLYYTQSMWKALNYIETVFALDVDVHGYYDSPQDAKSMSGKIVRAASQRCVLDEPSTHGKGIHLYMRMQIPECSKWNVDDEQFLKTVNCWPLAGQYKRCPSNNLTYVRAETLNALYRAVVRLVNVWAIQLGHSGKLVDPRWLGGYAITKRRWLDAEDAVRMAPHLEPLKPYIYNMVHLPISMTYGSLIKAPRTAGLGHLRPTDVFEFSNKILDKLDDGHKEMWRAWVQDGVSPAMQVKGATKRLAKSKQHKNKATTCITNYNTVGDTELDKLVLAGKFPPTTYAQQEKWEAGRNDEDANIRHLKCCRELMERLGYLPSAEVIEAYYRREYHHTRDDKNRLAVIAEARAYFIESSKEYTGGAYSPGHSLNAINEIKKLVEIKNNEFRSVSQKNIDYATGELKTTAMTSKANSLNFDTRNLNAQLSESESESVGTALSDETFPLLFLTSIYVSPSLNCHEVIDTYFDQHNRNIYAYELDVILFVLSTYDNQDQGHDKLAAHVTAILGDVYRGNKCPKLTKISEGISAHKTGAILRWLSDLGVITCTQKHIAGVRGRRYALLLSDVTYCPSAV